MQDNRNLILAFVLSAIVLFGYQFLVGGPLKRPPAAPIETSQTAPTPTVGAPAAPALAVSQAARSERSEALAEAARLPIETPRLHGSLSLAGGRVDDLALNDYWETVDRKTQVTLLSPAGSPDAFFIDYGWKAEPGVAAPTARTVWTSTGARALTPETPVTLTWDNGAGLVFTRTIVVDANYLFTIRQSVANHGAAPVTLTPFSTIYRTTPPSEKVSYGPSPSMAGFYGSGLDEIGYKDLAKAGPTTHQMTGGWAGFNDKYWLITAAPARDLPALFTLQAEGSQPTDPFAVGYQAATLTAAPGATIETTTTIFAGAKERNLLVDYEDEANLPMLDRTVDFGWLYILAKPFFLALHYIFLEVGNFGVAILIFNVLLKIILFPLQDRSFHQMSRMRDLQPKIAQLKEKFGDDKEKMAQAQMELFRKEKINPASGCLPILVQLPIFYALLRVLSTSIEMRHAPFFGWIRDLSAPDPTNVFTLFGLIPIDMPHVLTLGAWPLIYGATMFWQQRMTPTPTTDPAQARIMMAMPLIFMFFFAQAPAGLTIYYSWNAVLTMAQMALIRRRSEKRQALLAAKDKG